MGKERLGANRRNGDHETMDQPMSECGGGNELRGGVQLTIGAEERPCITDRGS